MILDVANNQRIENPSAQQVEEHLRSLSPAVPFIILDAAVDCFMQATLYAKTAQSCRVEYREGDEMHYANVPLEQAVRLLEAFRVGNASYKDAVSWQPLRLRGGWSQTVVTSVLIAVLLAVVALAVWSAFR